MTARVYVHVGPHKTGTTFIQQVLHRNGSVLADAGVLFPGTKYGEQRAAVLELLRRSRRHGRNAEVPTWMGLAAQVRAWPGALAIISVENLDTADDIVMARLVESFAPAEVHVVYTARDLEQVLPAMWHTDMRNRQTATWSGYISSIRGADPDSWPRRLQGQDPRLVLDRWEGHVPRDRIHVVTVPRPGTAPNVLWERFCSVVGLDAQMFSLDVPRVNKSLGTAETELLRRINERVRGRIGRHTYDRWIQVFIARRVLEPRPGQQKYTLPREDRAWVQTHSEQIVDFLRARDYEVTGDLQELISAQTASRGVAPDSATDLQVLDAAVDAVVNVLVALDSPHKRPGRGEPLGKPRRLIGRLLRAWRRRSPWSLRR